MTYILSDLLIRYRSFRWNLFVFLLSPLFLSSNPVGIKIGALAPRVLRRGVTAPEAP